MLTKKDEHPKATAFFDELEAALSMQLERDTGIPYNSLKRILHSRDERISRYLHIQDALKKRRQK